MPIMALLAYCVLWFMAIATALAGAPALGVVLAVGMLGVLVHRVATGNGLLRG